METFVVTVVLASAGICQGFVKGGYGDSSSSGSVTYLNRITPDQVQVNQGSSTLPTVGLNINGAHTLAGEAILHHVVYNRNGVPVVTTINGGALNGGALHGGPINRGPVGGGALNGGAMQGAHYHHGGYTHLLHLQNGGRPVNSGGMVLPASGADIFSQLLTPNGMPDNRHVHVISGQPFPQHQNFAPHQHFHQRIPQMNREDRTRKPDVDTRDMISSSDRRITGMATLASLTSHGQMSGMDSPSTKTV